MNRSQVLGIAYFVHPLPLAAVAVLILNDRWLKQAYPNWWTGKLSDVAGLFFFPLFLCAVWNVGRNLLDRSRFHWITRAQVLWAIALTDLVFIAIKVCAPCAEFYISALRSLAIQARVTPDVSDLLALVSGLAVYAFAQSFINMMEQEYS